MTEENKQNEHKEDTKKPQDHSGVMMTGHIKIFDPETIGGGTDGNGNVYPLSTTFAFGLNINF